MSDWLDIPVADLWWRLPKRDKLFLTDRQLQVLQCRAKGMSAKETGRALHMSSRTIEIHWQRIKSRIGFNTTAQTIITADRLFRQEHPCDCQQTKPQNADATPCSLPSPRSKSSRRWSRYLSR